MTLNWHKAHSTTRPDTIDETSSKTSVYLRKNITEQTKEDFEGNQETFFEYDEAILTKDEYSRYQDKLEIEGMIAELAETLLAELER